MKQIKSINPVKTALSIGIIFVILGVITGLVYIIDPTVPNSEGMNFVATVFGLGQQSLSIVSAIIFAPIFSGIGSFIATLIICWIYNLIAKKFPIEINI